MLWFFYRRFGSYCRAVYKCSLKRCLPVLGGFFLQATNLYTHLIATHEAVRPDLFLACGAVRSDSIVRSGNPCPWRRGTLPCQAHAGRGR